MRIRAVAIPFVLLLGLAACGDDGSVTSANSTATVPSTSAAPSTTSAGEGKIVNALADEFASGDSVSRPTATCMAQAMYDALGAEGIVALGMDAASDSTDVPDASATTAASPGLSTDQATKIVKGWYGCDFLKEFLASSAKTAGVTMSDSILGCVADKAQADPAVLDVFVKSLTSGSDGSDDSADTLLDDIARGCGVSDADIAKLNATTTAPVAANG